MDVTIEKLKHALEESHAELVALAQRLSAEDLARPSPNEGWTVKDLLVHLATAEPGLQNVARGMLRGENVVPADFDLDRWNQRAVAKRRDATVAELIEQFRTNRQRTLELLATIAPEELVGRRGRHPAGMDVNLADLFRIMALHERRHIEDIRRSIA